MRKTLSKATTVAALLPVLLMAGCGGTSTDSTGSGASSDGASSAAAPLVITVTISGESVTPNGKRVKADLGQPIKLKVTADEPGEIHVHSSPEQELEYAKGTSTVTIAPIKQPGVIDVESHALEKTIVQLQVS